MPRFKYIIIFLAPVLSYLFMTLYFNQLKDYNTSIFIGDQGTYFEGANYLYGQFNAHPYRCIGYPLLLGLPEIIGLNPPYGYWPIILNFIFLLGVIVLLLKIEKILAYPIALPVSIALSLCFGFIWELNMALTEIGFVFFTVMALYFLLKLLYTNIIEKNLFFLFFSLGFASLFRPGLYLFTLITALVCFLYFILNDIKSRNTKAIFKKFLSICMALLITLGSQSLLMKKTFNTYRLSYIDDLAWYLYIGALANSIHEKNCISSECFAEERTKRENLLSQKSGDEMSVIAREDRANTLKNKRTALLKAYKTNIVNNLVSSGSWIEKEPAVISKFSVLTNKILTLLPFIAYVLLLLTKFRKGIQKNEHLFLLFILCFISYIFITSGISTYQGDRFHLVFYPFSLLFFTFLAFKIKLGFNAK